MKILFATDGSECAAVAASQLAQLATSEPMHLTVISVSYRPDDLESGTVRPWYAEWRQQQDARMKQHYAQIDKLIKHAKGSVHMVQIDGSPAHEILSRAEEMSADLIVLGARGHTLLDRLLIGSVSENVALHAKCSVLIVRQPDNAKPPQLDRLTIAYDGSSGEEKTLHELKQLDLRNNQSAELVSVLPEIEYMPNEYVFQVDDNEQAVALQTRMQRFRDGLSNILPNVNATLLKQHHVGDAIVQSAEKNHSDAILIGSSSHGALLHLLLGSTTRYVLRHASCSVWIIREKKVLSPEAKLESVLEGLQLES